LGLRVQGSGFQDSPGRRAKRDVVEHLEQVRVTRKDYGCSVQGPGFRVLSLGVEGLG
jgi:hypothetical protein